VAVVDAKRCGKIVSTLVHYPGRGSPSSPDKPSEPRAAVRGRGALLLRIVTSRSPECENGRRHGNGESQRGIVWCGTWTAREAPGARARQRYLATSCPIGIMTALTWLRVPCAVPWHIIAASSARTDAGPGRAQTWFHADGLVARPGRLDRIVRVRLERRHSNSASALVPWRPKDCSRAGVCAPCPRHQTTQIASRQRSRGNCHHLLLL
jgi:hypothetical protein